MREGRGHADRPERLSGRAPSAPRRITLRDVAAAAGVSRMTVTRFFLRPEQVDPATRARVGRTVAALGYVPDRAAGSLVTRRSGFVALLLPTLSNSNFAALAEGLSESLRPAGLEVLVGFTCYRLDEEERQLRAMLARRPELVILTANAHTDATVALLRRSGVPVLEIAGLPDQPLGGVVGFSNRAVGRAAALHLIGLGLTRLAALGPASDPARPDSRGEERLDGFAAALAEYGLPCDDVCRTATVPISFEQGAVAMAELLDRHSTVEGVFAISDLLGVGALMECRRRNIGIPDRLCLIGFGDFEIGRQMIPPLSTIAVDFLALGHSAGRAASEWLVDAARISPPRVDIGFTLLHRGSTDRPSTGTTGAPTS